MDSNVVFPITITFEDGSIEQYKSVEDLQFNLEYFNSDRAPECRVVDAQGRRVHMKLEALELKELQRVL